MESASRSVPAIRFGVFEVDLRAEELRKNGTKLRLRGQPFQVLAMLVERPGEIVTREELQERLWPEGTFVDFDHSLNTAINKIREVLGDSAENPRFVETLARRGYRFIARVEEVGRTAPPEKSSPDVRLPATSEAIPDEQEGEKQRPTGRRVTGLIWLAAFSLLILGSASWIYFRRPISRPVAIAPMKVSRFTSYPGKETDPALSPDGKQLAFAWDGQKRDNFDIYVQLIGGEKPLQLTTDSRADLSPAWSPDGRYVAFARISEGHSAVHLVPSLGGRERILAEVYSIWSGGKSLDWSPDGKSLVVTAKDTFEGSYGLLSISVETRKTEWLTSAPMHFGGDTNPAFSPDGQSLAFTREDARSNIYLLSPLNAQPRRLTFDNASYGSAWTPDGREIIFLVDTGGNSQLSRVFLSGQGLERMDLRTSGLVPSISRQGNRLAYVEQVYNTDIWRIPIHRNQERSAPPINLISSSQRDENPQYSPDGKRIVFVSDRSRNLEIWVCDSDGRNPFRVTWLGGPYVTGSPRWSPDGRFIAFDSWSKNLSRIFVVSAEGGSPRPVTEETADGFLPNWSKDGRWIYFCSMRSGQMQIWKMPTDGGQAIRVTKNGGFEASEGADGNLYYSRLGGLDPAFGSAHLWKISKQGGEETPAIDKAIYPRYWAVTDGGIYFVPSDWSSRPAIEFFSFAIGRVTEVVPLDKPPIGNEFPGLSVSPDGRWILCALIEQDTSDIMLVENFR